MLLPLIKGAGGIFCVLPAAAKGFFRAKPHKTQRIFEGEPTYRLKREKAGFLCVFALFA